MNMLYISLLNGFGIFTIFLYTFNFAIEIMYTLMFEILISYLQIVSETNHNGRTKYPLLHFRCSN